VEIVGPADVQHFGGRISRFPVAAFRGLTGCCRFVKSADLGEIRAKIRCLTLGVSFVLKSTEHRIEPRFGPETALKKQLFFLLTNF
jgi:hypothetical protein